ncbi:L-seryl-tRNA selenium transferase [Candidatus Moduliflexus flocculans]|uniref:L-seryl-tRNA(Sec) selenium transferase n=1 Tax=Candidatus Moduliflexus flocculans TaxID=1499966 RepID=A0A081BNK4_9BACT|nr:L-seryl-tRNA selenium transferase [Candidatus Moduliflexus flocculans]
MEIQERLRQIPKVDVLLQTAELSALIAEHPREIVVDAIRAVLQGLRDEMLRQNSPDLSRPALAEQVRREIERRQGHHLKRVINGTGIIVHTNLGRSNLSQAAIDAVIKAASAYSNLEYSLETGRRGSRYSHIEGILQELLGCETALVVNNNAAAVLLVLTALAQGKEAIVSRGELVEIGGSFRIPDVIQQGGCILREVGATNRTHLRDYEQALSEQTGLLLRVHTSNYRVVGFTKTVTLSELKALSVKAGVPFIEDMGSGLLVKLPQQGLDEEPTVQESLAAGVDVVTFSGDKLLGGPQAGVIVGKRTLLDRIKAHPLHRAVRVDKMTLAALEATLMHYRYEREAFQQIPTLQKIVLPLDVLRQRAERLCELLRQASFSAEIVQEFSQVGGGALPIQNLPTWCVALTVAGLSANELELRLRMASPPIIGRIANEYFLLDVRTLETQEFSMIVEQARMCFLEQ